MIPTWQAPTAASARLEKAHRRENHWKWAEQQKEDPRRIKAQGLQSKWQAKWQAATQDAC